LHIRKRKQLQLAIQDNNHSVIVIEGPAGSGKRTAVNTICKDQGIHLVQWIPPCTSIESESQVDLFCDFMVRGHHYQALMEKRNWKKTVVLVAESDMPNISYSEYAMKKFRNMLESLVVNPKSLVVFLFTYHHETSSNASAILGKQFMNNASVHTIK
jgi:hypothetical protein